MSSAVSTTLEQGIQTWTLDPSHTQVGFAVKHLMISSVKGRFPDVTGSVSMYPGDPIVEVDISMKAASITTNDAKRDAHLRSADFLNADIFPVIQFRGQRLDGEWDSRFVLHGDLTIRGVTRPVVLYVISQGRVTDPWGNDRVGYTATTSIHRKDFGLEWNMALEAGGVLVGDEVRITIETELVRQ